MFLWYPFDFIVESNLCGHKTGFKRMSRWKNIDFGKTGFKRMSRSKNIDFGEQPPNKNRCWWLLICLSLQLYIQSGKENYRGVLWKFLCTFQWVLRQNLSWCWRKDLPGTGNRNQIISQDMLSNTNCSFNIGKKFEIYIIYS